MFKNFNTWAVLMILIFVEECLAADGNELFSCVECTSSDPNCVINPNKITTAVCDSGKCFTKVDSTGKVTRGCVKEETCGAPTCLECKTSECNVNQTICKNCNSANDPKCSQTNAEEDTFNYVCEGTNTKCFTGVEDSNTVRRCALSADEQNCANSKTCELCSGTNCNIGIYPSDRRRCYQCDTTNNKCLNPLMTGSELTPLPCRNYKESDNCYTYAVDDKSMIRGCVSDTTETNKCSSSSTEEKCSNCDSDNCNRHTYTFQQSLQCVQCNSKENMGCEWAQTSESAKDCISPILYNDVEQCYTQIKDGLVYRGCLHDRTAELGACTTETNCTTCSSGNGCNNRDGADFSCIICRSDEDERCRNDATALTGTTCRNIVAQKDANCYAASYGNLFLRGCLVDADDRIKLICNDKNNKQCTTCSGKNCNVEKANSSGAYALVSSLFTTSLLIALCQFASVNN